MTSVLIAVDPPRGMTLAAAMAQEGFDILGVVPANALAHTGLSAEQDAHLRAVLEPAQEVVLDARRDTLTAQVVSMCDAAACRIVPLTEGDASERVAVGFGLATALPIDVEPWILAEHIRRSPPPPAARPRRREVVAVWGPAGAPGRTTLAVGIGAELARRDAHVCLIDADSHAPAVAQVLGIPDEGPGFAAVCRQARVGPVPAAELARIAVPVTMSPGSMEVLVGLNRPSRWPELSGTRVGTAVASCREWADHTVVDVAASLEHDEEIVSDLPDGPRRNAATLAALSAADAVVAVAAADPIGIARCVRAFAELRGVIGSTPVSVVVNKFRGGPIGVDARGQIRRTLDRFAGIDRVWFVPFDPRAADAMLLQCAPIGVVAPRSPAAVAIRRVVTEGILPAARADRPHHPVRADVVA